MTVAYLQRYSQSIHLNRGTKSTWSSNALKCMVISIPCPECLVAALHIAGLEKVSP